MIGGWNGVGSGSGCVGTEVGVVNVGGGGSDDVDTRSIGGPTTQFLPITSSTKTCSMTKLYIIII